MDLMDRFFGKGTPRLGEPPVANPRMTEAPSFQLLFTRPLDLEADALSLALREYHPELETASVEIQRMPATSTPTAGSASADVLGLTGWGRHVVKLIGYDSPLAAEKVEPCVLPAHYEAEIKEDAYRHASHVVLFYAGYEPDVLEQHVALAAVAAALARLGAVVVMNETAHTSVPAMTFLPHEEDEGDTLKAMRNLPLPFIYAGFVKMEIEEVPGVWMRTFGCHAFKLPDLAFLAEDHHQGTNTFGLFSNMLLYLRQSKKTFAPGDTMGIGGGEYFSFRARTPDEWFLESPGEMLVVERMEGHESSVDRGP